MCMRTEGWQIRYINSEKEWTMENGAAIWMEPYSHTACSQALQGLIRSEIRPGRTELSEREARTVF